MIVDSKDFDKNLDEDFLDRAVEPEYSEEQDQLENVLRPLYLVDFKGHDELK